MDRAVVLSGIAPAELVQEAYFSSEVDDGIRKGNSLSGKLGVEQKLDEQESGIGWKFAAQGKKDLCLLRRGFYHIS